MNNIIDVLRTLYNRNRIIFVIAIIALTLFLVGCSTQGSIPPPSGPIGRGC